MSLLDNLVVYYDLNEASGAAIDAHASFDLAAVNSPGAIAGGGPGGQDVRSVRTSLNQVFQRPSSSDFQIGGGITCAAFCWLRMVGSPGNNSFWGKTSEWNLRTRGTPAHRWLISTGATDSTDNPPQDGVWRCVTGWYDGGPSHAFLSVNLSTPVQTTRSRPTDNENDIVLGARHGPTDYVNGDVVFAGFWKNGFPDATDRNTYWNGGSGIDYAGFAGGPTAYPTLYYERLRRGMKHDEADHTARVACEAIVQEYAARRRDRISMIYRRRWIHDPVSGVYTPPATGIIVPRLFLGRAA